MCLEHKGSDLVDGSIEKYFRISSEMILYIIILCVHPLQKTEVPSNIFLINIHILGCNFSYLHLFVSINKYCYQLMAEHLIRSMLTAVKFTSTLLSI